MQDRVAARSGVAGLARGNRRAWLAAALGGIAAAGCGGEDPSRSRPGSEPAAADRSPSTPLHLTVVDDRPLADAIERQWKARAEGPLKVRVRSLDEMRQRKSPAADALIYPARLLGEWVERDWLLPLPARFLRDPLGAQGEVFDLLRLRETRWGEQVLGITFGSPVLTLCVRADAQQALQVEPPSDWQSYPKLVEQVRAAVAAGRVPAAPEGAVLEPLAEGWAGKMLLARAAGYVRRRDQFASLFSPESMDARIASEPFVQALEELARVARQSPRSLEVGPAQIHQALARREAVMGVTWPQGGAAVGQQSKQEPLTYHELPGSLRVYNPREAEWEARRSDDPGRVPLLGISGRIGSVSRLSGNPRGAFRMLAILSSKEWSPRIVPKSAACTLFRDSHVRSPERWLPAEAPAAARQYAEVVQTTLARSDWLFCPRIPGQQEYLRALDAAVRGACRGKVGVAEALQQAAKQWNAVTDRRGRESQRKLYQGSLVR